MTFNHSSNIDAREATINTVGRDQSNIQTNNNIQNCNVYINLGSAPERALPLLRSLGIGLPNNTNCGPSGPTTDYQVSSQRSLHSTANRLSEVLFVVDIAVGLIIRITSLLVDPGDPSNNRRDLELELKSLQQTLTLIRLAIQEYDDRPLGQSLAYTITPAVQRCSIVLSELHDKINGTGLRLLHTSIRDLWRPVWWSRWLDDGEVASLKMKLRDIRISLGGILSALNSVAWIDLGNELRAGHVSLKTFHAILKQHLPRLGHIQVQAVQVVDHLGQNIPVPFPFCSRWEDFDHIINGFCRNRPGNRYVTEGEYEVMNPKCSHIITRSDFASTVKPGTVLEMNIIMRKNSAFQANKKRCPRPQCGHINWNVTATRGWIEWKVRICFARFQAAEAGDAYKITDEKRSGHSDGQRDNNSGEKERGSGGGGGGAAAAAETIRSLASTKERATRQTFNQRKGRLHDEDEARFFCRIHVIYRDDGILKVCMEPPMDEVRPIEGVFSVVNSSDNADLVVLGTDDGKLQFEILDPKVELDIALDGDRVFNILNSQVTQFGLHRMPFRIEPTYADVYRVIHASAHYHRHLRRHNMSRILQDQVQLEFRKVKELDDYDDDFNPIVEPVGDNLNVEGVVDLVVDTDDMYGIKLVNNSPHNLYPALFFFDNSDLSISSYYQPPTAAQKLDIPLRKMTNNIPGSLCIGYGSGGSAPFSYFLREGQDVDVGFLKLFLTTKPVDYSTIPQTTPFDVEDRGGGRYEPKACLIGDTIVVTVVQRRVSSAP